MTDYDDRISNSSPVYKKDCHVMSLGFCQDCCINTMGSWTNLPIIAGEGGRNDYEESWQSLSVTMKSHLWDDTGSTEAWLVRDRDVVSVLPLGLASLFLVNHAIHAFGDLVGKHWAGGGMVSGKCHYLQTLAVHPAGNPGADAAR